MGQKLRHCGYALLAALCIFLLILAPARLLLVLMPEGFFQSTGVIRGSLWQGSASSVVVIINDNAIALGAVDWKINPLSMPLLSPEISIRSQWRQQQLFSELELDMSGNIQVDTLSLSVPAGIARHWVPLSLGGELILNATQVHFVDGGLQSGEGTLRWKNASWKADAGRVLLGDYLGHISIDQNALRLQIDEKDEPVGVSGWLEWDKDYRIDMTVISANPALRSALLLIATEDDAQGMRIKIPSQVK